MKKIIQKIKWLANHRTYSIVFCIPLFILMFLYVNNTIKRDKKDLEQNGCFTVAKTMGTNYYYRHGIEIDYKYFYNGKEYKSFGNNANYDIKKKNGYYLIKISRKNPEVHEIYFDRDMSSPMLIYAWEGFCDSSSQYLIDTE